jgi:hypothetical protein
MAKRENGSQPEHERTNGTRLDKAPASELIRSAEKFIASGKLALAKEQLSVAQALDPNNSYIPAILDRLDVLETRVIADAPSAQDQRGKRYLSVTVGSEFRNGIRPFGSEPQVSAKEIQNRIRRLTSAAENFLENGAYKNAFESLMKAYLLDPLSPFVIACEQTVLPAWERARAGKGSSDVQGPGAEPEDADGAAHV